MFGPPKIARPNGEIPDSALLGTTRYACASTVMPTNMRIASVAIATSVADAFFASGGRNAGTPFDTASTPVIAVHPLANAVRRRNVVKGWWPAFGGNGTTTCTILPVTYR